MLTKKNVSRNILIFRLVLYLYCIGLKFCTSIGINGRIAPGNHGIPIICCSRLPYNHSIASIPSDKLDKGGDNSRIAHGHYGISKIHGSKSIYNARGVYKHNCTIPPIGKPITILVYSFWGHESSFNSVLSIDGSISNTGLDIKDSISKKLCIPKVIQTLYVCNGPVINDIPEGKLLRDDQKLEVFIDKLILNDNNKELEMHLLLDLPAPIYNINKISEDKVGEYLAALTRHYNIIKKLQLINNDFKSSQNCRDNINSFIQESHNLSPINDELISNEINQPHFIKLNKRLYLLYFKDYPPYSDDIEKRIIHAIKHQFPIDISSTLKFTITCLLIRNTINHNKVTSNLLLAAPIIMIVGQTRPGVLLTKILFHMLPTSIIPNIITNLLPAHVAEKIKVKH